MEHITAGNILTLLTAIGTGVFTGIIAWQKIINRSNEHERRIEQVEEREEKYREALAALQFSHGILTENLKRLRETLRSHRRDGGGDSDDQ